MTTTALAKPKDFEVIIAAREGDLESLLAGTDITPQRFIKSTVHALARQPKVMQCDQASILLAVLEAAEMGLEPTGAYGGAHLVPYGNKCGLIVDYRGFIKMALRSGQVSSVMAALVYDADTFSYELGTKPHIQHVPALEREADSKVTHVYAVYWTPEGHSGFVVMTHAEVEAVRRMGATGQSEPWKTSWGEMAKKTAVRRLFKLYPVAITPQLATALEHEDRWDSGAAGGVGESPPAAPSPRRARVFAALTGQEPPAEADDGLPDMPEPAP